MRMSITVMVEVDERAVIDDNPPESVVEAIRDEVRSHLESDSVRGAVGITAVQAVTVEALNT
jgi:hypothetical protein